MSDITIRPARLSDGRTLARLAQLDSQAGLAGDVLLAEVCDRPVAALERDTMRVVADPFEPTADVVELLRMRARTGAARSSRPVTTTRTRLRAA